MDTVGCRHCAGGRGRMGQNGTKRKLQVDPLYSRCSKSLLSALDFESPYLLVSNAKSWWSKEVWLEYLGPWRDVCRSWLSLVWPPWVRARTESGCDQRSLRILRPSWLSIYLHFMTFSGLWSFNFHFSSLHPRLSLHLEKGSQITWMITDKSPNFSDL